MTAQRIRALLSLGLAAVPLAAIGLTAVGLVAVGLTAAGLTAPLLAPGPASFAFGDEPIEPPSPETGPSAAPASPSSELAVHPAVIAAEQARIEAIARACAASISVFARGGQGGGSGVVVTPDGYALTNFHVVKPCGDYMQCSMPDGKLYDAVIVGIDPVGDVALIKLLGREDFPTAEMADSDEVRVGDWCFAVGNPFLLATDFQPTVSYGIVSGVHRYQYPAGTLLEYADCIQTDAAINPGNSGGPLFNAQGRLIGINGRGSFEKRGRVNVGVGYAISINQIKNFMGCLKSGRILDHATLGATVATEDGKVLVTNVLESSDAWRRGLRFQDEIIQFGGRPIHTANALKNALGIYPRDWRVPLSFLREGERRDVMVRLQGVHSREELLAKLRATPTESPDEEPKSPDEEPKPDQPDGDKPSPEPKKPRPDGPHPHGDAEPQPVPEHVAKWIVEREGYANYYFNELNRDRVWSSHTKRGDFSSLQGDWILRGELAGSSVEIVLGDAEVRATLPNSAESLDLSKDLDQQLAPEGSGGMLVALHLWRRMLLLGPKQYGDVYYVGEAPVLGREPLADLLAAVHDTVEARFYFDVATGELVLLESIPDASADPCEVYFSEYRELGGRWLPHRIEVRHGDEVFTVLDIKSIVLPDGAKNES